MSDNILYKIIFHSQGKIYEVYAKSVLEGGIFGFIEIEKLVFGENSSIVVDPSEENLKSEFKNVVRSYIPMHSIIRIDEVSKQGAAKITETDGKATNVMPFPVYPTPPGDTTAFGSDISTILRIVL